VEHLRIAPDSLSPLQLAFARRTGAYAGLRADSGAVFFYREDAVGTARWLLDHKGHVLDFVQFSKRRD
jgi:hypothetical protein